MQFQQTMTLKEYKLDHRDVIHDMDWKMTKIEDAFWRSSNSSQGCPNHKWPLASPPLPYHFSVIASKASHHHNQTCLLFYIHWGPKGRESTSMLLLVSAQCFKKESSSFKGKRNKENLKYIYFGIWCSQMFLSMIPSCSHQVPNGFF
jgi:hypothetical protein